MNDPVDIRATLKRIKQALILDQDDPWALAEMARLLHEKGMSDRAMRFIAQAVRIEPGNVAYRRLYDEVKKKDGRES